MGQSIALAPYAPGVFGRGKSLAAPFLQLFTGLVVPTEVLQGGDRS